jgi:hypothetical protein
LSTDSSIPRDSLELIVTLIEAVATPKSLVPDQGIGVDLG